MKPLHQDRWYCWSQFDAARDMDFHSFVCQRPQGNVVVDPLPISEHDLAHLRRLGGASWVVVTNSDHVRDAERVCELTGAQLAGPHAEKADFPLKCHRWLGDGAELLPGVSALEMNGSKTPGELALLFDGQTLVTGDLVRGQRAGELNLLPGPKLRDPKAAIQSVQRLGAIPGIEAVLPGDGWPVFRNGAQALRSLIQGLS